MSEGSFHFIDELQLYASAQCRKKKYQYVNRNVAEVVGK